MPKTPDQSDRDARVKARIARDSAEWGPLLSADELLARIDRDRAVGRSDAG